MVQGETSMVPMTVAYVYLRHVLNAVQLELQRLAAGEQPALSGEIMVKSVHAGQGEQRHKYCQLIRVGRALQESPQRGHEHNRLATEQPRARGPQECTSSSRGFGGGIQRRRRCRGTLCLCLCLCAFVCVCVGVGVCVCL